MLLVVLISLVGGSFGGDLTVGGNLTIGGTFGESVSIADVTAQKLVVTGIMSGTTTSSAVLNTTTITGNVTQDVTKQASFGAVTIGGTATFEALVVFRYFQTGFCIWYSICKPEWYYHDWWCCM